MQQRSVPGLKLVVVAAHVERVSDLLTTSTNRIVKIYCCKGLILLSKFTGYFLHKYPEKLLRNQAFFDEKSIEENATIN
jgi:hypothetical protein